MTTITTPPVGIITNAGPWFHDDGTPCPNFWATTTANDELPWWCTEHLQYLHAVPAATVTEAVSDLSEAVAAVAVAVADCTHIYDTANPHVTIVRMYGPDRRPGHLFKITANTLSTGPSSVHVWTATGWTPLAPLHGPTPEAVALAAHEILAGTR